MTQSEEQAIHKMIDQVTNARLYLLQMLNTCELLEKDLRATLNRKWDVIT